MAIGRCLGGAGKFVCLVVLLALVAGTYLLLSDGEDSGYPATDETVLTAEPEFATSQPSITRDTQQMPTDQSGGAPANLPQLLEQPAEAVLAIDDGPSDVVVVAGADFVTLPPHTIRWSYNDEGDNPPNRKDFNGTDLSYVDLAGADLRGANFEHSTLRYADLREANLQDAVFGWTNFENTDMRGATLSGATMAPPVSFHGADLRGADLRSIDFSCQDCAAMSQLMTSLLNGADLRGVNFGWTIIADSVFDSTDLRGADLSTTTGRPKSLRGALYDHRTRLPDSIDPSDWQMIYVQDED